MAGGRRILEDEDRPGWIQADDGNWYRDAGSLHDSFATHRLMPDLAEDKAKEIGGEWWKNISSEFKKGYNSHEGMLSGAWDKAKEIGGEWWKNISSDKGAYRREFEDTWFKRLGYSGMPRLEMYKGESAEADFDRDWRLYWDEHPDNLSLY